MSSPYVEIVRSAARHNSAPHPQRAPRPAVIFVRPLGREAARRKDQAGPVDCERGRLLVWIEALRFDQCARIAQEVVAKRRVGEQPRQKCLKRYRAHDPSIS
jgi:hypothetical protein